MSDTVRILPCGPHAVLAEYSCLEQVIAMMHRLSTSPPAGAVDIVPGARTILVTVGDGVGLATVTDQLREPPPAVSADHATGPPVSIDVIYDGADLAAVGETCAMAVDDVVAVHSSAVYTAAFCGFVPGFSYLVGLDPRLHLPRRPTPRTRVPAGSVAIAGEFSAVYPAAVPGGWHLLGRTDVEMWDETRPVPALLPPGTRVRFVPR